MIWFDLIYLYFMNIVCILYCVATMYSNNMTAIAYTKLLQNPGLRGVCCSTVSSAFLITSTWLKGYNHVTCDIQNQCSWWDLADKAIFDCLSLSFELGTKPEGTFWLMLEARVFFIVSRWVPAHDLDVGQLCPSHLFVFLSIIQAAWLFPSYAE